MARFSMIVRAALVPALLMATSPAHAAKGTAAWATSDANNSASSVWGTSSMSTWGAPGGSSADLSTDPNTLPSANTHAIEKQTAQAVSIGSSSITGSRSITACGNCTYIIVTGNGNNVSGNTINGTNNGTVSANGSITGN